MSPPTEINKFRADEPEAERKYYDPREGLGGVWFNRCTRDPSPPPENHNFELKSKDCWCHSAHYNDYSK